MRRCLTLLLLLAATGAQSAEVVATLGDGKLGARLDAIAFPASLPKELTSGLTNRLYARVSLMDAQEIAAQRTVEIAIRYDLWDEKYSVVSAMDGAIVDSRNLAGTAEMNALLRALPLPKLFDISAMPAARRLVLSVDVLLNPIDREKMRMIRKWVAQNSTPVVGGDQGVSMSNTIFNRIFEQYADGSNEAASWRVSLTSASFTVESLSHEGR
jgi:hypothetical protein